MSTLVVLGGADGAITTLRAARRLGVRTICVDGRCEAPAAREADEFLHASTADLNAIVRALRWRTDLAGIVSPASDVNVPSQVALGALLKLSTSIPEAAVRASVDKAYFRTVSDRLGLPGPRFVHGGASHVTSRARQLSFPVIVKPNDLGGGRGITRCSDPDDLAAAVAVASAMSPSRTVIVEEFLSGTDLGMEAVIVDGRVALLGVSRRVLSAAPHFATLGHDMSSGPDDLLTHVGTILENICAELGYLRGSLNADLLITDDGRVVLLEMGTRLGGNGVAELLGLVNGVDVTEASVLMAIGEPVDLVPCAARFAGSRVLTADVAGTLLGWSGVDQAAGLPEVADLIITAMPGEPVEPYTHCRAKLGLILAVADAPDQLTAALTRATELARPEIAPHASYVDQLREPELAQA